MENQVTYEGARLAAEWWTDRLKKSWVECQRQPDKSDEEHPHSVKDLFYRKLREQLNKCLAKSKFDTYLSTDYEPDNILCEALQAAGVVYGLGTLPCKVSTWVGPDSFSYYYPGMVLPITIP